MRLSRDQLRQYHEDGFLIVRDFFRLGQFQPVIEWINRVVDELAQKLYAAGKIKPHVSEHFPLARAGEAIAHLASRKAMGKVVVTVD